VRRRVLSKAATLEQTCDGLLQIINQSINQSVGRAGGEFKPLVVAPDAETTRDPTSDLTIMSSVEAAPVSWLSRGRPGAAGLVGRSHHRVG